jgi:GTP-binding protein HflX
MGSEVDELDRRAPDGTVAGVVNPRARQRALAIGVTPDEPTDATLAELRELLRTAGVATAGELVQRRPEPDPDRYFGRGKLAELKAAVKAADANLIAVDDELLPRQERNLEKELGLPVIDRTAVILDIFADHAHSAEGKLQVELAQLEYNLARMRGLWTHLQRLGAGRMDGGIGTRGPGESQIETDRRLARDRISALRRRLKEVGKVRGTMRAQRAGSALPTVALAGYTNAGKSTLLNAITGAGVGVGDRLFHTLDPTTRAYEHDGRRYLLTDTVGFIRKLPHALVDAFKATLEETTLADLILHVVDASDAPADRAAAMAAVEAVLKEIGADAAPRLTVYNKIDLLDEEERARLLVGERDAVGVSAATGEGIPELLDAIEKAFEETLRPMELLFPYDAGGALSDLHAIAGKLEREDTPQGVRVEAKVPTALAHRFHPFVIEPGPVNASNGTNGADPAAA